MQAVAFPAVHDRGWIPSQEESCLARKMWGDCPKGSCSNLAVSGFLSAVAALISGHSAVWPGFPHRDLLRILVRGGCAEQYLLQRNCLPEPPTGFVRPDSFVSARERILLHSSPHEMPHYFADQLPDSPKPATGAEVTAMAERP